MWSAAGPLTALVALAGLGDALRAQAGPTTEACVQCHLGLRDERMSAPARDFPTDVHAEKGFGCLDCHGRPGENGALDPDLGFLRAPARKDIPALCGRCHSDAAFMRGYNPGIRVDQVAEYWTSGHGRALQEGDDPDVATCADCHQVHRIRPPADPASSTYALNVPETCGACHADPGRMTGHGMEADQLDAFRGSVHGRLIFEDGDLSAPVCNDCHGNHGAAPPGIASVRHVCGQCHTIMADYFDGSAHRDVFEAANLPGCATCHDHHAIQSTSDANLDVRSEQVCRTCHEPEDEQGRAFETMARLLDSLTVAAAGSREILDRAENAGMEVSQALFELEDVNTALMKARSAIHSFHVDPVRIETEAGLAITARGFERGVYALEEHRFRRVGLAASAGIILLLIAGILMKIRYDEALARDLAWAHRDFFDRHLRDVQSLPSGEEQRLTSCAILLEAAEGLPSPERAHLESRVRHAFGVPPRAADALVKLVRRTSTDPVEAGGRFADLVMLEYSPAQVRVVLEELWFLVYSDPQLARRETLLFESLTRLLHMDQEELASARRSAGPYARRNAPGNAGDRPW